MKYYTWLFCIWWKNKYNFILPDVEVSRENNFQESNFYDTFKRRDRGRLQGWIFVLVLRDLHASQTVETCYKNASRESFRYRYSRQTWRLWESKWRWCRHTLSSIFCIFRALLCGAGLFSAGKKWPVFTFSTSEEIFMLNMTLISFLWVFRTYAIHQLELMNFHYDLIVL